MTKLEELWADCRAAHAAAWTADDRAKAYLWAAAEAAWAAYQEELKKTQQENSDDH
jgi:hypothetical protein